MAGADLKTTNFTDIKSCNESCIEVLNIEDSSAKHEKTEHVDEVVEEALSHFSQNRNRNKMRNI